MNTTGAAGPAGTPPTEAERAAAAELLPMMWGIHISRAIYAVAELGIAVAARAGAVLGAAGLGDRCEVLAGDFFTAVPPGADRYVLANVLHDWDDARAAEILGNCRRAMARGGRVLIAERLIPDDPGQAVPTLLSDINMLVLTGGQERTNAEYGALLAAAGLRLTAVRPVAFPYGVIEAVPAQK